MVRLYNPGTGKDFWAFSSDIKKSKLSTPVKFIIRDGVFGTRKMAIKASEKYGILLCLICGVILIYLTYVGTHPYVFRSGPGFSDTLLTYGDSSSFEIGLFITIPFFTLGLWLTKAHILLISKFLVVLAIMAFCITTWNVVCAPVIPPTDVGLDGQYLPADSLNYWISYILAAICLIIGIFVK